MITEHLHNKLLCPSMIFVYFIISFFFRLSIFSNASLLLDVFILVVLKLIKYMITFSDGKIKSPVYSWQGTKPKFEVGASRLLSFAKKPVEPAPAVTNGQVKSFYIGFSMILRQSVL